jgi:hypothetical protein
MAFNFVPFLVIILPYPFSTYLKQPPRLPDDYLFGLGSFGFVLGGEQGVAMGAFTLMRRIHEDTAIFSEVIHIAILIVVLAGADRFAASAFRSQRSLRNWIDVQINQPVRTSILLSAVISLLVLSSILLYQTWIARFLGSLYVTLCSIVAFELASIVTRLRHYQHRNALAFFLTIFTVAILPASRCPALFLHY